MRKRKGAFSKAIIALIVIMNTAFTVAVLLVFLKTSQEPVALIGAWFGFTTGELWLTSKIKRDKLKEAKKDEQNQLETEAEQ